MPNAFITSSCFALVCNSRLDGFVDWEDCKTSRASLPRRLAFAFEDRFAIFIATVAVTVGQA